MKLLTIATKLKGQVGSCILEGDHGEIALIAEKCSSHSSQKCKCEMCFLGLESGCWNSVACIEEYDLSVEMLAEKIQKYSSSKQGAQAKAIAAMALASRLPIGTELKRSGKQTAEIIWAPVGTDLSEFIQEVTSLNRTDIVDIADAVYEPVKAIRVAIDIKPTISIPYASDVGAGAFQRVVKHFNEKGGEF